MSFDPNNLKIHLVESVQDVSDFMAWLHQGHRLMGFDIETSGLNWVDGQIRLAQFGTEQEGWAIPFQKYPWIVHEALCYLRDRGTLIVGHNVGGFDMTWMRHKTGFIPDWSKVHDTMLLLALLDTAGSKALKDGASVYVHPCARLGQKALHDDMDKNGWDWATVPIELPSYWFYGVMDTILTVNLFLTLLPIAEKMNLLDAYATERHVEKIMHGVSWNGLLVDEAHCVLWQDRHLARCAEIKQHVTDEWGIDNIGSGQQLATAFENSGVVLTVRTKSGNQWAMDADTLDLIAVENQGHPLVALVTEYRRGLKYGGYYGQNLDFMRSDGRVHPSYKQCAARTLRMSANAPPIQTQPRVTTDPEVRNSFISAPGMSYISADLSNVEARLFALLSGDTDFQRAFTDGLDVHCWLGGLMYNGGTPIEKKDPRRNKSKNSLFASIYGAGAAKLAVTAGITLAEAVETQTLLKRTLPSIRSHSKAMEYEALHMLADVGRAGITLRDGRVIKDTEGQDLYYKYSNFSIQGTARLVLAERLIALDNAGVADRIVAVIHDEVVVEVPDDETDEYTLALQEHMEDHFTYPIPLTAGVGKPAKRMGQVDH